MHKSRRPIVAAGVIGLEVEKGNFSQQHALGAIPQIAFVPQAEPNIALPQKKHDDEQNG